MQAVVEVTGVNESNKNSVCDAFAAAVSGIATYCSLSGPNTRRLLYSSSLYIDISVADANTAMATMGGDDFISNSVSLPTGVQATSLTTTTESILLISDVK